MRIITLDGTPLSARYTGIERYTTELWSALTALRPEEKFAAVSPPEDPGLLERHWWSIGLPRRLHEMQAVLFHGTDFAVPMLGRVPSVVTVHDLSPLRAKEWKMPDTALRVARRLPRMINRAAVVIAPSERVKEEIASHFNVSYEKIFVTPLAASAVFTPCGGRVNVHTSSTSAPDNPVRICRGLLSAFAQIKKGRDLTLMIVGGDPAMAIESDVKQLNGISDSRLAELYSGASAVIYPSLYEGFGLPVVEAMACGAPVITSRDTAAADVAGGAAMLVDATSTDEMAAAMSAILDHPELAASMRAKSLARAAKFSWQQTAQRTWEAYESALSRS